MTAQREREITSSSPGRFPLDQPPLPLAAATGRHPLPAGLSASPGVALIIVAIASLSLRLAASPPRRPAQPGLAWHELG